MSPKKPFPVFTVYLYEENFEPFRGSSINCSWHQDWSRLYTLLLHQCRVCTSMTKYNFPYPPRFVLSIFEVGSVVMEGIVLVEFGSDTKFRRMTNKCKVYDDDIHMSLTNFDLESSLEHLIGSGELKKGWWEIFSGLPGPGTTSQIIFHIHVISLEYIQCWTLNSWRPFIVFCSK